MLISKVMTWPYSRFTHYAWHNETLHDDQNPGCQHYQYAWQHGMQVTTKLCSDTVSVLCLNHNFYSSKHSYSEFFSKQWVKHSWCPSYAASTHEAAYCIRGTRVENPSRKTTNATKASHEGGGWGNECRATRPRRRHDSASIESTLRKSRITWKV